MSKVYKGIDISLYQGKPDFEAVKKSGIDFVMLKASQGRTADYDAPFADPEFEHNAITASRIFASGYLYVGTYHYLCARNFAEAEAEADFFIDQVKKHGFPLWAAVDVEDSRFLPADRTQLTSIVERFCEKVKSAGLRPMIYASSWWIGNRFDPPAGVPIWEANWSASEMPSRARMWQYSSTGEIAGITGNVDLNLALDIIGDANGDGKVDVRDAIDIARSITGWKVNIDRAQADIDRDGKVTIKDAVECLRRVAF